MAVGLAEPGQDWRESVLEAKDPPERVPRIYTRLAPVYEVWARATESKARRRVLELASVRPGEDVLEVATGTGVQLVHLAGANGGGRTVGVEISEGMLAQTRGRLEDTSDPDQAIDVLTELAEIAKQVEAEIEQARREADA